MKKNKSVAIVCWVLAVSGSACAVDTVSTLPSRTVVFTDDFTGTDGANLSSSWGTIATGGAATITLSSNRAYPAPGAGASIWALYNQSLSLVGYTATVDLVVSGGSYSGDAYLLAKVPSLDLSGAGNGYLCGIDSGTGKVTISKAVSGTVTQLAASQDVVGPLADGTTASLSFDIVDFVGSTLTCVLTLNGTQYQTSVSDGTFMGAGYWGMTGGVNGGNTLYFDNFKIVN